MWIALWKATPGGDCVANFTLATTESWKDKQTGQQQERTEWHRVVFFNRLAEIAGEYLRKGSKVYLEGKIKTNKWQNKEGTDQYTTEIVANNVQFLTPKDESPDHERNQGGYEPQGGGESSMGNDTPF